jgi:hypothetical protein
MQHSSDMRITAKAIDLLSRLLNRIETDPDRVWTPAEIWISVKSGFQ